MDENSCLHVSSQGNLNFLIKNLLSCHFFKVGFFFKMSVISFHVIQTIPCHLLYEWQEFVINY